MSSSSNHGAATRRPVVHGGRRIPGLHERDLMDGGVVYEARLRIDGKDCRIPLEARTVSDAVREYEGLRVDRDRGVEHHNPLINPTIAELADEWVAHQAAFVGVRDENLRTSENSVRHARVSLGTRVTPYLGRKRVAELTLADVRRLIATLTAKGYAPGTVHTTFAVLAALMSFAAKQGYVERNIVHDLPLSDRPSGKRSREPRYLTADEVSRLLANTRCGRWRAAFACMAYAGLRVSEALGLRWKDIDLTNGQLTIAGQISRSGGRFLPTKTAASKATVPMLPALTRELAEHRVRQARNVNVALIGPDQYVFALRHGLPGSYARALVQIRTAAKKAGLDDNPDLKPIAFHDLRHSFVALAFHSGATIAEVAELARHADPSVTLRIYAGLTEDGKGRAAAKMLDAGFGA